MTPAGTPFSPCARPSRRAEALQRNAAVDRDASAAPAPPADLAPPPLFQIYSPAPTRRTRQALPHRRPDGGRGFPLPGCFLPRPRGRGSWRSSPLLVHGTPDWAPGLRVLSVHGSPRLPFSPPAVVSANSLTRRSLARHDAPRPLPPLLAATPRTRWPSLVAAPPSSPERPGRAGLLPGRSAPDAPPRPRPLRLRRAGWASSVLAATSSSPEATPPWTRRTALPRTFSFGDSVAETGNICVVSSSSTELEVLTCTHPPYGTTYFSRPSCRWSDGRVVVDFIGTRRPSLVATPPSSPERPGRTGLLPGRAAPPPTPPAAPRRPGLVRPRRNLLLPGSHAAPDAPDSAAPDAPPSPRTARDMPWSPSSPLRPWTRRLRPSLPPRTARNAPQGPAPRRPRPCPFVPVVTRDGGTLDLLAAVTPTTYPW
ncbi:vegetative cell wall protein gp1-like [Panicum hallii]|uniref:vegetative cell wall protein gp1-like n=1 Tax=Panicum hallii TaxID=206008 RepID=UPI000DF4E912|nr:vegetative cell wall protein gp1-like [Panicum hallii]